VPHTIEHLEGEAALELLTRSHCKVPVDDLNFDDIAAVAVIGSSFSDPGPDWCEYQVLNHRGEVIRKHRIAGY